MNALDIVAEFRKAMESAGLRTSAQIVPDGELRRFHVEGDRSVLVIAAPEAPLRQAHHLTFGLDGAFYSSKGVTSLTQPGFQTIAADGTPTGIDTTVGMAGDTFVVLANGDFVIRGNWQTSAAAPTIIGILLFDASEGEISLGIAIPNEETSESDELVISADGSMILLSRPAVNEIVRVAIDDE